VLAAGFVGGAATALLGAIVGGVLAIGGAVWVMRRERTRIHRETIYAEILPRLEHGLGPNSDLTATTGDATALQRLARLASRRDFRKAEAIGLLAIESAGSWGVHNTPEQDDQARERMRQATDAIEQYEAWLEAKLR
jgi:hypothetical protein